jgi:hypothetical protein
MARFVLKFGESRLDKPSPTGVEANDLREFARRADTWIRAALRSDVPLLDCNCTAGHFGGVDAPPWEHLEDPDIGCHMPVVTEHILAGRGERGHRVRITSSKWLAVIIHDRKEHR